VNPGKSLECARDGNSGEREDVLQDAGEVLIDAVGESLFANPGTPLVLSDLGGILSYATVRRISQRRFDIAVLVASAIAAAALLL